MHRLVGDAGAVGDVGDQVHRQEQADDLLDGAEDDPAGSGEEHPGPPAALVLRRLRRHEAQVVVLLGDLGDERQTHAGGQQRRAEVEALDAVLTLVGEELADRLGMAHDQVDERRDHQDQPQRRRPDLKCGKHFHAVDDQREDDERRRRVADPQRDAEPEFEALGHDRALEGEEDEGERREDDVGDHRAVVAEAAAAGDQVEVDVVSRRVVGDREIRSAITTTAKIRMPHSAFVVP